MCIVYATEEMEFSGFLYYLDIFKAIKMAKGCRQGVFSIITFIQENILN